MERDRFTAIHTITTTPPIIGPDQAVARLLAWLSPAFPSGGFSHSHGLEWVVEKGEIVCATSLRSWLADLFEFGALRSDGVLLVHAHCAAATGDRCKLVELVELAAALASCRERQVETMSQGRAFAVAAPNAWSSPLLEALATERDVARIAYPVAIGVASGETYLPLGATLAGFLHATASTLVSAAVRLVPLGQTAALTVLAALEPTLVSLARELPSVPLEELGGAAFRSDLAAMLHETQATRLFRT